MSGEKVECVSRERLEWRVRVGRELSVRVEGEGCL